MQGVPADTHDGKLMRDSGFMAYRDTLLSGLAWAQKLGYGKGPLGPKLASGAIVMPEAWTRYQRPPQRTRRQEPHPNV